jgi:AraC-like DNA-binding protein
VAPTTIREGPEHPVQATMNDLGRIKISRLSLIGDWEALASEAKFQPALMARKCETSLRHLERYFEHQFCTTPTAWCREVRGLLAVALISQGWSCKAVAVELQFANPSHFCHEFKKVWGVSPSTFAPGANTGKRLPGPRDASSRDKEWADPTRLAECRKKYMEVNRISLSENRSFTGSHNAI